ncbi:hypothetical protein [Desulforapulum autotrophicum]|uniref:hypothetical protein n=1 Tax=Desulforapulum autotrophicum TaxID=2296 RepID=UPI00059ED7B9|nr:hypothetical protein [Desulforapulum autotrophicum]
MKLDSSRPVGTGVALNGLNGNGGHEVQGVAISLGAGHGQPARMSEGQHPFPPAGRSEFHIKKNGKGEDSLLIGAGNLISG